MARVTKKRYPRICLTAPVRNRAWMLPAFLGCIEAIDYPRERLGVIIYDDGSDDSTVEQLAEFKARCAGQFLHLDVLFGSGGGVRATSSRDSSERQDGFPHLAQVRNELMKKAIELQFDGQFSVDSDVLVSPGCLSGLMSRDLPHVSAMIFNNWGSSTTGRTPSFGGLSPTGECRPYRGYELDRLYPCAYTGAVYLVMDNALRCGAQFAPHRSGEDIPYCLSLQRHGFSTVCDTTLRAVHVMEPRQFDFAAVLYSSLFESEVRR